MKNKNLVFIISAPSGTGKGSILKSVLNNPNYFTSISDTTRDIRDGEVDGVHYNFISKKEFEKNILEGRMLEWAEFSGENYGTPRKSVEENILLGKDIFLELEVVGALKVKKIMPEVIMIFIMPPSIDVLRKRLEKRNTETKEKIDMRIETAKWEISKVHKYDYVVVNRELESAIEEVKSIISAEKHRCKNMKKDINEVLENV